MADRGAKLIELRKTFVSDLVVQLSPQYADAFRYLQGKGKCFALPPDVVEVKTALNAASYVNFYDDERALGLALLMGLLGEEVAKELIQGINALTQDELDEFLLEFSDDLEKLDFDELMPPKDERGRLIAISEFERLDETDTVDSVKRAQWLWGALLGGFFQMLSVMVHGQKLTSLVRRAIAGDQDAFCKALQVDKSLTVAHPKFLLLRQQAQDRGDWAFLKRIGEAEVKPVLRSRIRYPGLYVVFAMLDSMGCLDRFTHSEILDICDAAGLDRYQNRIEDVNYLTKRLLEYRAAQKFA